MEEDDPPPHKENSYWDKITNRIMYKRKTTNRVFHTRHTRRIAYPRTGQFVLADVSTQISEESLGNLTDEVQLVAEYGSSDSPILTEHPDNSENVKPTPPHSERPDGIESGLPPIPENSEIIEPTNSDQPDSDPVPPNPPDATTFEDRDSGSEADELHNHSDENVTIINRPRRKVHLHVENNHRRDHKPAPTKPAHHRSARTHKFYRPGYVHQLMERAGMIGMNQVPKWQQDGIDLIQDVTLELAPIYRCLSLADSILHTPAQGSNVSKIHHRLVCCFLYIGILVKLVLPDYHEGERFLEHIFVHLSKIEKTTTNNMKLCEKLERRTHGVLGRLSKDLQHEIYTGILSLNIMPPDPGKNQDEITITDEDTGTDVIPGEPPDPDQFTLIISSFTSSLLLTCQECPDLGSVTVKDLQPLQLLCLIQILLEDIERNIQLVAEQLETGLSVFNSIRKQKKSLSSLKVHMVHMRKDMFLRPNNCSGALSQAFKGIARENANLESALHSVAQISRWTLEASESIFAEARHWAPGTKMESPYQIAYAQQRRRGFGILNCFGTSGDILEGRVRTFQELFAAIEGSDIVDALQMMVPVHKARKEFLFSEHFDQGSSVSLVFEDSRASLASHTLSILQFLPAHKTGAKPEAEVLTNTDTTKS